MDIVLKLFLHSWTSSCPLARGRPCCRSGWGSSRADWHNILTGNIQYARKVKMQNDVLIVGAGPVGLTMAAELARYGVSVRIVEKAPQRTDKSKALVVWSRTLELIDRMGCSAAFLTAGYKVSTVKFIAKGKEVGHVTLDGVVTPYPYALMIPQSETERLLDQHLNGLGVHVERKVEFTKFVDAGGHVLSTVIHADGTEETIESSWLIGCDGAHSAVRHQLGLEFHGDTQLSDWILADVHLDGDHRPEGVEIHWHSDGVLAIFPITQERFRVVADIGVAKGAGPSHDPALEEVQDVIDRRGPGGLKVSQPVWLAGFRINDRKVDRYRVGRVFLAGDSAHIHSPAGGQGMNTGMQDAFNLAWKLALVCRDECAGHTLLESYTPERSAVGDQVLKVASVTTAIGVIRGDIKQSIRNHVAAMIFGLPAVRQGLANTMTELSIGYGKSPLNGKGSDSGKRALIRSGEMPVGAGRAPRFVLFADASEETTRLVRAFPALVDSGIRQPFQTGEMCLVRPDGYVAASSRAVKDIEDFLCRFSGTASGGKTLVAE
jgi:2-polyprenyl-6-methoxyphenol hydroxylase-like FAD-dependent oxidoreductase